MPDDIFQFLNRHVKVSHETFEKLSRYRDLLLKWQHKINLVASSTLSDSWNRHFLDSLQLINHIENFSGIIVDLGSGAGFPGMVLAIAGAPQVHLIESDGKKIIFLKEVARITETSVQIHHTRIENTIIENAQTVVSRACAELDDLLALAFPQVSCGTICLFPKGKNYSKEIIDAKKKWMFDETILPSVTDTQGVILRLTNIKKRGI